MESSVSPIPAPEEPKQIRVVIVDDHPAILMGLRSMLSEEDSIQVVATFESGEALEHAGADLRPEVVLLDLRMPGTRGVDCIAALLRCFPSVRILVISSYDMDEEIFRALEAGALGYIGKNAGQEEIVRAIRKVYGRGQSLPPKIAQRLHNRRNDLTARELEVLTRVARGHTSKQIAASLRISEFTVRNHVNSVIGKLHVQDRTEAAVVALKRGLVRMEDV